VDVVVVHLETYACQQLVKHVSKPSL
jgi:hypothetical protein